MKQPYLFPLVIAGTVVLAGCFDSSSTSFDESNVRVIHASPNAPAVNVTVDDDEVVEGADYKEVALLDQDTGTYSLGIDAVLPDGADTVLGPLDLNVEDDTRYEVIAIGSVGADEEGTLDTLVFDYPDETFESDTDARFRVAHLAEAAGEVEVYLSAPEDEVNIGMTAPSVSLAYTELADPIEVPGGDYRIQVTAAGDDDVVFDSGAISLNAGDDLLLGAVTNTGVNVDDSRPISLMVIDGDEVTNVYDVAQQAGIRVVHNSAGADTPVDVYLDGELSPIDGLPFGDVLPVQSGPDRYVALPADTYEVQVTAAEGSIEDAFIETDLELVNGQGYTIMAVGMLDDIEAQVLEDNQRSIATQASLRIVHGSTEAGNVDVYLLAPGERIGNAEPTIADVAFRDDAEYLAVEPGEYDIVVASAGAEEAFRVSDVSLEAGGVYTAIARDDTANETLLDFILLDDFIAAEAPTEAPVEGDEIEDEIDSGADDLLDDAEDATDEAIDTIEDIID